MKTWGFKETLEVGTLLKITIEHARAKICFTIILHFPT
jgi:hypothetical protein